MSELLKSRPEEVRTIPVKLPGGRTTEAHNLNDVVRQLIWDMKEEYDWSWVDTAANLGVSKQTLKEIMTEEEPGSTPTGRAKREKGMTLFTLSKIVAARAGNNPVLLFKRHQLFMDRKALPKRQQAEAAAYDGLCALLTAADAVQLREIVEVLVGEKDLRGWLETNASMLSLGKRTSRPPPRSPAKRRSRAR